MADCTHASAVVCDAKTIQTFTEIVKAFDTNLKVVKIGESLISSESLFQLCGALQLNAASLCLVCTLGTVSNPLPGDLRGPEGSKCK